MEVIANTTFIIDDGQARRSMPPESVVEVDDQEGLSLIARGLARPCPKEEPVIADDCNAPTEPPQQTEGSGELPLPETAPEPKADPGVPRRGRR